MEQIQNRFGPAEKGCLAASTVPLATLLASRVLPQTAAALWIGAHAYRMVGLSVLGTGLALTSAAIKHPKSPSIQGGTATGQLVLHQPHRSPFAQAFQSIPEQAIPQRLITHLLESFLSHSVPAPIPFSTLRTAQTFPFGAGRMREEISCSPAQGWRIERTWLPNAVPPLLTPYPHADRPALDVQPITPADPLLPPEGHPVDIRRELALYLLRHGTQLSVDQTLSMAQNGNILYQAILSGQSVLPTKGNARDLMWHFVVCQMVKEGSPSEEWMWKIEDPNLYLTKFFQSVEGCDERISSHFKGRDVGSHKGFDVDHAQMPAAKGHVLVIQLDPDAYRGRQFLALKPENYGVATLTDTLMHGGEFVQARYRKLYPGMDEAPGWRKEHLPACFTAYGQERVCELLTLCGQQPGLQDLLDLYSDLEVRDGNEAILRLHELHIDYLQWEQPLEDSWIDLGLPQTAQRIRPDKSEALPGLVRAIQTSLQDEQVAHRQITRDLNGGDSVQIEGVSFHGKTAAELVSRLQNQLSLTPALAKKTARLLTQTCMPDISEAVGTTSRFAGEDGQNFLMERDESSKRVVQDEHGVVFSVVRDQNQLTVVAKAGFYIQEGSRQRDHMAVTLTMDPLTEEAHYVISLA